MHSDVDVPRRRRTGRDWMVDLALFGVAVFSWIYISGERLEAGVLPPQWLFELDQLAGLAGIGMVWLRRRWPVPLAIAAAAASSFSETIAFPLLVLLFSVTAHCRPRSALVAFALAFAAGLVHVSIRPDPSIDAVTNVLLTAALVGAPAGILRLPVLDADGGHGQATGYRLRALGLGLRSPSFGPPASRLGPRASSRLPEGVDSGPGRGLGSGGQFKVSPFPAVSTHVAGAFVVSMQEYLKNRNRFPAEELEKYAGRYVAWSPDVTGIVASGEVWGAGLRGRQGIALRSGRVRDRVDSAAGRDRSGRRVCGLRLP
jgi:hypothetical protein